DDGGEGDQRKDPSSTALEERLKKLKSKSFCASCGRKGHWHKDVECPNYSGGGNGGEKPVRAVEVCHHVPAEVMTLKYEGEALVGITDTACAKSVAGTGWLQRYSDLANEIGEKVNLVKECEAFRFGTGKIHYSAFNVKIRFVLGTKLVSLKVSVINGDVPLLMSKRSLAQLGMIYDVARNVADFSVVGLKDFALLQTTSGHPAIPINPAKAGECSEELLLADNAPGASEAYMAFMLSGCIPTTPKPYKIFYDKKLSPEVKQMLTQDRLSEASFLAWWDSTNIDSDFWLEGEFAWTGKPIESAVDVVERGDEQSSFPLFWFGRTTFAKAMSSSGCRPPPIHKMNKVELLAEANRVGVLVHHRWTVEEIKAVIQEHRMENDPGSAMKSITNLTLDELKAKANNLGVMFGERITKGNLIRLIRDHTNTPDQELMKIGRFKGYEFGEIPKAYGEWASKEVRVSSNPHPELVRFAKWFDGKTAKTNYAGEEFIEEHGTVPFPPSLGGPAPSTTGSFGTVDWSVVQDDWGKQSLVPPKASPTKRRNEKEDTRMIVDNPVTPEQEIEELERRLAELKKKAAAKGAVSIFPDHGRPGHRDEEGHEYEHEGGHFGNKTFVHDGWCCGGTRHDKVAESFITDGDFVKGHYNQNSVFAVNPGNFENVDRPQLHRALQQQDYSYGTIKKVLEETSMKAQKNTKGKALGAPGQEVLYETLGLYTHGGVYGVTTRTKLDEDLARYMNRVGQHLLPDGATWSSVTMTKGCNAAPHHDYNNSRESKNHVFTTGGQGPGSIWIETKDLTEDQAAQGDVKWRSIPGRGWVPGRLTRSHNAVVSFDPFYKHATHDWDGERWCVIYHTTKSVKNISPELSKYLKNLGFHLPKAAKEVRGSAGTMPRRTTRKTIFNNAAKLSVMFATLIAATDSFFGRGVYANKVQTPIVMFEIGSDEGTEEAVRLDKDVFEPMTWERYNTSEGKETAHHIVNGGYPRELRVSLKGKRSGDDEALRDLIELQVNSGGTAVLIGDNKDTLVEELAKSAVQKHKRLAESFGDQDIIVYYKEKSENGSMVGVGRVHDVCVVEGQEPKPKNYATDGSAIKFDSSTPPGIAQSLRRLHQNLGHPRREDLLRHLRLAGCNEDVLKAVKLMTCDVCAATGGPKIQRPSALPHMLDFGEILGIDIFYAHDASDVKHTFLSVADYGTTFHQVVRVDGQSAWDIEEAFNTLWITPYGAPKSVAVDLDGGLQTGLARLCDWHGIEIRSVAAQGHWQAGVVERQQAWWKNVWERIVLELSITEDEIDIAVPIDLDYQKTYATLTCSGEKVTWDVSAEARFQRQSIIRASARVAFHKSQIDNRLRKALLQRARTTSRKLEVGESVHFWHQRKNRRRGEWEGPGIIVGSEGDNYWISKGGRCRLKAPEHVRPSSPEEVGEYFVMKGLKGEVEKLLEGDPDNPEVFEDDDEEQVYDEIYEDMDIDPEADDGGGAGDIELGPPDEEGECEDALGNPPLRRLKRKTKAADLPERPTDAHDAMMLKTDLTRRGVEKRKEKELKWSEIPPEMRSDFRSAEVTQWQEHLAYDALAPLTAEQSAEVRKRVDPSRILRSRWAYRDKNYARRREGDPVPWKCKSRLVIAGHTDPDLGVETLSTDAPTLSRAGLACLMQKVANGLKRDDAWHMAAGDIRCAFLTGSYLARELYIHQPATGFPGMNPGDLVRVKKNVFGLATSPHEWWLDLQNGIYATKVEHNGKEFHFEQCGLDPCIFSLREYSNGDFTGKPVAYIGCHVDDILIAAPKSLMKKIQAALSATFPIETWEEDEFEFLGSHFGIREDTVYIDQAKYAETRLFSLDVPKGAPDEEAAPKELIADNRSLIGALSWMSAQSRPDLTCSVSMAQQLQQSPSFGDLRFTNAVAGKAKAHKDCGLRFKAVDEERLMVICYHDAAWANVPEPDNEEDHYKLTYEDDEAGIQHEAPISYKSNGRRAKKGSSKVASQLGCLVLFADRGVISGQPGDFSIADWKSRAGQRVCRSTFGAETQACVEGLETAQYMRSLYESLSTGTLVNVDTAVTPILCLSDCRSLFDHLTRQGIPRVPSDKRLAVDLAALRQSLKSEKINGQPPIAWIPGETQLGDVLTKPQNPANWWDKMQ
ncbi:RE2, partial [Symbiodinium sp. CCMP2456]